jgi:hypothetical protein
MRKKKVRIYQMMVKTLSIEILKHSWWECKIGTVFFGKLFGYSAT